MSTRTSDNKTPPERARYGSHARWPTCVALAVAIFAFGVDAARSADKRNVVAYPALPFASDYGGPFSLTDQTGRLVTNQDFQGRFVVLYFGYTSCADICPLTLHAIGTALTAMGKLGEKITPLFVNLDANNNSVGDLKAYVEYFHPRILGLTGTIQQIRAAASAYRIRYRPFIDKDGTPLIVHSGKIFFLGPDGKVLAYFPHEAPVEWLVQAMTEQMHTGNASTLSTEAE